MTEPAAIDRPRDASLDGILAALYGRVPLGMRLGLEAMRSACARLGHPEQAFAAVHVAGTNGKGSVCAMVEAIARAAGLRTGLYTSPHLCRFAERIQIDGTPIADDRLAEQLACALADSAELSFFEAATLTAFLAFRQAAVDLAIVEVGLGGRLDATNVLLRPRAAAITRIARDHTDRLGSTLTAIAREKAGIAKPGLDIVLGPMAPDVRAVIDDEARRCGATTSLAPALAPGSIGLAGAHQADNARIAAALGARIGASPSAVRAGIANVRWPGRLERIGAYLLDAAHNPDGAASLAAYVETLAVAPARVALVFGALSDKEWKPMLDVLAPLASSRIYLAPTPPTAASRPAVDPRAMAARADGEVAVSVPAALALARGDLIIVAGSMMLVGAVRASLLALRCDPPVAL